MTSIDDPRAPPLPGGQADDDSDNRFYYTWATLLACFTATIAAMAVTTMATSSFLCLSLASLVGSL